MEWWVGGSNHSFLRPESKEQEKNEHSRGISLVERSFKETLEISLSFPYIICYILQVAVHRAREKR